MLSIIIVNWNTRAMLHACLASIEQFPPEGEYEVIVVDNASTDRSLDGLNESPRLKLLPQKCNLGYAAGNNEGYQIARGDQILLLNPDTEFRDRAIATSQKALHENPTVGCVAIRLIDPEPPHATQKSIRAFPTPFNLFSDYRQPNFDYEKEQLCEQPMGTYLLFRKDAIPAGEFFDPQFPIFFNEVDLLYRMKKNGWPCLYLPQASVLHHGGASTRQVKKKMIWESHRSLVRYFRKHLSGWQRVLLPGLAMINFGAAWVRAKGYDPGFRPDHHDL